MYATQPKATQSQEAVINILNFNTEILNAERYFGPKHVDYLLLMSSNSLNVPDFAEILTTVIFFYISDRCLSAF